MCSLINEYIILYIGSIIGFSIPSMILGLLCMTTVFSSPLFGIVLFTLGCSGISSFILFVLWKNAQLPLNYY